MLEDEGHQVSEAANAEGHAAVERERLTTPLLDSRMPGEHGLDACCVKGKGQAPDTAVVIVSGEGNA